MWVFTICLFILTVISGCLSYAGLGHLTETVKLTYAYLALLTAASGLLSLLMRPPQRGTGTVVETRESVISDSD